GPCLLLFLFYHYQRKNKTVRDEHNAGKPIVSDSHAGVFQEPSTKSSQQVPAEQMLGEWAVTQGHTKNQVGKEDRGKGHEGRQDEPEGDMLDSQQPGKGVDELQHTQA